MNLIHRTAAIAALLSVSFGATSHEPATKHFNDRSIIGTWALSVEGFVSGEGAIPGDHTPLVAIGTVTFDGRGNCDSVDQLVVAGSRIPADPAAVRVASECTYEVGNDGIGFFQVTFPAFDELPETTTTASFVVRDRRVLHFIAENSVLGIYGGGILERQRGQ